MRNENAIFAVRFSMGFVIKSIQGFIWFTEINPKPKFENHDLTQLKHPSGTKKL